MTATTVVNAMISGIYAKPQTVIGGGREGATVHMTVVTHEAATTSIDEAADVILLCPLNWTDRVMSIKIFNDDLDSHSTPTLACDVGLYKVNVNDGTVTLIDADAYASAITTLQAANTAGVEIAFEARDIIKVGQTVLTDAALTAVPVDVVPVIGLTMTTAAATAVAGSISMVVQFAD